MIPAKYLPALFCGHGNPMNALQRNAWTEGWATLGRTLPRPRGIVCVSAHWYIPETAVTAMSQPRMIYDFGGFPPELSKVRYPAPGSPQLAQRVAQLLTPAAPVRQDQQWGLDHGAWSVLILFVSTAPAGTAPPSKNAAVPAIRAAARIQSTGSGASLQVAV